MNSSTKQAEADAGRHILLVEDDPAMRRLLSLRLESEGYRVRSAEDAEQALAMAAQTVPGAVITDLRMHGMDGMALQERLSARWPGLPVVIITAHGTIPDAVSATQSGALGFLTKPIDTRALLALVDKALSLGTPSGRTDAWRGDVIGVSASMTHLLERARRVARSDANVLITGPSGSGKDALACAIHRASGRTGELVAVNCAAIPATLLESELFGHCKGAFTGANSDSQGLMRRAHGGTLMLDEIGDMPPELQVKLLRVLEERRVRAVGSQQAQPVNLRIIAATHRDLDAERAQGRFRDDLYYRLRVVHLDVPALDERRADIPALVQHKLGQLARGSARSTARFSPSAMERLMTASWPGNVRQLFNVVEHCVAMSPAPVIGARLVDDALAEWRDDDSGDTGDGTGIMPLREARDGFMRDYLLKVMQLTNGDVSRAARVAQRNRTDFYKLLNRHHIDWHRFRAS